MKGRMFIVIFMTMTISTFSQWNMVDSSKTNIINDFISSGKYIFVAGGKYIKSTGILKRSTDGATWQTITNGLSDALTNNQITGSGEDFYMQSLGVISVGSGSIFHSSDGGLNWTKIASGFSSYSTTELTMDGNTLIALLYNDEFYTSNDGGKTWTSKSKITSSAVLQGLVSAGNKYYTYSAALNGYYYSEDKCSSWSKSNLPNVLMTNFSSDGTNVYMVANDAKQTPYMLTATGTNLVNGAPIGGTAYSVDRIAGFGNAVFATGHFLSNYIYASTDQLQTWKDVSAGIPGVDYHIEKILINGDYIYLAFNSVSVNQPSYQIWRRKLSDFNLSTGFAEADNLPIGFTLSQNYPNPFNPTTKISFSIAKNSFVTLKIYNAIGEVVSTLVNQTLPAGNYSYDLDASPLTSGIYLYTLASNSFTQTKKMILIK